MEQGGSVVVGSGSGGVVAATVVGKNTPVRKIVILVGLAVLLIGGGVLAWYLIYNNGGADKDEVARVWSGGNKAMGELDEFFSEVWRGRISADRLLYDTKTMDGVREDMAALGEMDRVGRDTDHLKYGTGEENAEYREMREVIAERYAKYTEYMGNYEEFVGAYPAMGEVTVGAYEPSAEALLMLESESMMRRRAALGAIAYYGWMAGGALASEYPEEARVNYVGIFFEGEPELPESAFNKMRDMLLLWGYAE